MQRLAGRTVFTVGERDYRWEDVVLAGHLWGEQQQLEGRTQAGIACTRRRDDRREALAEAEVEEAADHWRYERDLLSADDMQDWLGERGIDMDEWLEFIRREVLRTRWSAELDGIVKAHKVSADDVDAVLYTEAVCSGTIGELADRLAGEAAIYDRADEQAPVSISKTDRRAILARLSSRVKREGVLGLTPALTKERAEFLAGVTLSFERFVDRIAAPAALEREIEAHALDWTRLDCKTVALESEEAAREAALLIRTDGLPLGEAAAIAGSVVEKTRYILEDVEPPLRDRLVGALAGELIGPLPVDGRHLLVSVVDRVVPSRKDVAVRDRARDRVMRRTIRREISRRVRWHERF